MSENNVDNNEMERIDDDGGMEFLETFLRRGEPRRDRQQNTGGRVRRTLMETYHHWERILQNIFPGSPTADALIRRIRTDQEGTSNGDSTNVNLFDTNLPAEHSYLGNLDRVSGVSFLEPGKYYKLLIVKTHSVVFPGETFPLISHLYLFENSDIDENVDGDGCIFGIVFPNVTGPMKKECIYGVTCQIYEKGTDGRGTISIKSRACQRFLIERERNKSVFGQIQFPTVRRIFANVKILPEIVLSDPLLGNHTNSYSKLRNNKSVRKKIQFMEAANTPWPYFLYNQYDFGKLVKRISFFLSTLEIETMPMDPVSLSFWCGKNALLDNSDRNKVFASDSVTERMLIINRALEYIRYFICRRCKNKLAYYNQLFAMSKQGVQTNFCNPAGIIHETYTIYAAMPDSIYVNGQPSEEFSWFPGYAWQIANCEYCDCHLGWKFTATKLNLMPKTFFGLTGSSVIVHSANKKINNTDDDDHTMATNSNSNMDRSSSDYAETDESGRDESD